MARTRINPPGVSMARRPSGLEVDPDLTERIAERVRTGSTPHEAAGAEGVPGRTFSRWLSHGENEAEHGATSPYSALWLAIARARAEAIATAESEMRQPIADADGRTDGARVGAVHKWLAANAREKWGAQVDVRIRSEAVEHVLERLRAGLDPATYERVLECLAGGEGESAAQGDAGDLH